MMTQYRFFFSDNWKNEVLKVLKEKQGRCDINIKDVFQQGFIDCILPSKEENKELFGNNKNL